MDSYSFNLPTIPEFYAGKNLFLTGGSGFIGKVLIEKLFRSCENINRIFILLRPKKYLTFEERVKELIKSPVFDKLKSEQRDFQEKLIPVYGDILLPQLGIGSSDVRRICDDVHIVMHCAATVRFNENLRSAMELNVKAVKKLIELSRHMQKLEVFLHVSTAYSNCDRSYIAEKVYKPISEPQHLIDTFEWMNDDIIECVTPQLLENKPNTYTFTKHLAEYLLVREGADLPLVIVRPSIVGGSLLEPFPGWIDNLHGLSGLTISVGKGILRSMKGESKKVADIVPVDIVVNNIIAATWYKGVVKPRDCPIFHCTTGSSNPLTWKEYETHMQKVWYKYPLDDCFRRPKFAFTYSGFIQEFYACVAHVMPACFADFIFFLIGEEPRMLQIYSKLHQNVKSLSFFTENSWDWSNDNNKLLCNHLCAKDKQCFNIDPKMIYWPTYIENYCLGIKKYLLKEDISKLDKAKARLRRLRNIRYCFNVILVVALWRFLIVRSRFAGSLWYISVRSIVRLLKFIRIV